MMIPIKVTLLVVLAAISWGNIYAANVAQDDIPPEVLVQAVGLINGFIDKSRGNEELIGLSDPVPYFSPDQRTGFRRTDDNALEVTFQSIVDSKIISGVVKIEKSGGIICRLFTTDLPHQL